MVWYYADGDRQRGPISEQEFQEMVANGRIHRQTLVWTDSMDNWQTLEDAREAGLVKIQPASPSTFTPTFPSPPPPETQTAPTTDGHTTPLPDAIPLSADTAPTTAAAQSFCSQCGRGPLGLYDEVKLGQLTLCPECNTDLAHYYQSQISGTGVTPASGYAPVAGGPPSPAAPAGYGYDTNAETASQDGAQGQAVYQTAALFPRFIAKMIDNMLVAIVTYLAILMTANVAEINELSDTLWRHMASDDRNAMQSTYEELFQLMLPAIVIGLSFSVLYNSVLISTVGATLGKMLFRIRVVTAQGTPVRFGQALLRAILPVIANNAGGLSALLIPIIYGAALIDPYRRTLIDRLAKTQVVATKR